MKKVVYIYKEGRKLITDVALCGLEVENYLKSRILMKVHHPLSFIKNNIIVNIHISNNL